MRDRLNIIKTLRSNFNPLEKNILNVKIKSEKVWKDYIFMSLVYICLYKKT